MEVVEDWDPTQNLPAFTVDCLAYIFKIDSSVSHLFLNVLIMLCLPMKYVRPLCNGVHISGYLSQMGAQGAVPKKPIEMWAHAVVASTV